METVEQIDQNFNAKKPKKKGLLIGGIILALIIIAFVLVYFLVLTNPKNIFSKAIDKILVVEAQNYDSVKMSTEMKLSVELEDTTYQEELEELERITLKTGTQMDVQEKQEIVSLGLEYDDEAVIDAQIYYNDGEMYAYFEDLFDKYIEIDIDEETQNILDEMFETVTSEENLKNTEKAVEIIRKELKAQIKENGKFDKEKEKIQIGKDKVKVTKSTLTISEKQLYKISGNMLSNLAKNDDFIDCFESLEEYTGESIKDVLKQVANEIKNTEGNNKNNIKISLYTKGFLNSNLVAVDAEIYTEYDESTVGVRVIKEDKGIYAYSIYEKEDKEKNESIKGKVEIQKDKDTKKEQSGNLVILAEAVELGSVKIEIDYDVEYNQEIDKINTSNSVNIEDLTDSDMESIMTELMDRPLIGDVITNAMGMDEFESDIDMDGDIIDSSDIDVENTLTTEQNEVKDEYSGYSVKYTVPVGFEYEEEFSYDYIKRYELENPDYSMIYADVTLRWKTESEYIEDQIKWDYEFYLEDTEYYQNVNLSEVKSIIVGDKTFKYQVLSYETQYGMKSQDVYIWYPLGDEYLFTVELEAVDTEITENIMKGFLNINVTE